MKIKKVNETEYIVKPSASKASWSYTRTYGEALYCAARELVGDTRAYVSLESFHSTLKMALNREFQGNLGEQICFKGRFFYPTTGYVSNIQSKVKYLNLK
jgi:hypothetical protein